MGIGIQEVITLTVIALLITPPDKVPELSRKAARVIYFLRNIANNATDQLRAELGPEYADLQLSDLNPKTFVQKHLLDNIQDEVDSIKAEVEGIKSDLQEEFSGVRDSFNQATSGTGSHDGDLALAATLGTPFDPEAT